MANHRIIANSTGGEKVQLTQAEEDERSAKSAAWEAAKPARAFADLREERNQKLAETDWQANSDVDMGANVATYRQQLRDLPAQYDNETILGAIVWPTEPS